MLIGEEFQKIEFQLFGLDLLEPNAFIGDVFIFILAFYFAYKLKGFVQTPFVKNWYRFFILFGLGFFIGGLGHLFYNYLGIPGKWFGWFAGIVYVFYIEQAIIPFIEKEKTRTLLILLSKVKLVLAFIAEVLVVSLIDLSADYSPAMKVPLINSSTGLIFTLAILSFFFMKRIHVGFKYFIFSVLVMLPSLVFQVLNINLYPWFDKNDVSHVFVFIGTIFYYLGVKSVAEHQRSLSKDS